MLNKENLENLEESITICVYLKQHLEERKSTKEHHHLYFFKAASLDKKNLQESSIIYLKQRVYERKSTRGQHLCVFKAAD